MKNLAKLKKYFAAHKNKLLLGILFIICSNFFTIFIPLYIKDAVNELNSQGARMDIILKYALYIAGASLISGVFRFMIRQTIIVMSRDIEYDLRQDFWSHIQLLPVSYFQNTSTGNIMAHATNDINAVRMFIGPAVMYSIDTFLRFILVMYIMLTISVSVTLYSLLPLPLLSFIVYFVGKLVHKRYTLIQEKFSELTTKAQENFSGIRVIKSYVAEDREVADFTRLSQEYLKRNMHLVRLQALFQPLLFMLIGISVVLAIWLGGMKAIEGSLNIGDITAIVIYLGVLIWPMIAFGWIVNIIQQAEASMKRLMRIMNQPAETYEPEKTTDVPLPFKGKIEFKNVSFRYSAGTPVVLQNINLTVPAGTTLAVMGATGSGKSTFVHLLPRLHECEGDIFIDGVNIKEIPLRTLRRSIGFVPQETFLFSDSIRNNILYGAPDAGEERMLAAASTAQFDKDVQSFPNQYDTLVGERGITMSGGQKQRCALARALVLEPSLLILDDAFSAVDTHTEEEILRNLRKFMAERTSILISHRVSTVKDADMIVVLEKGTIAEQGTHDELLALGGLYASIHEKQLLEKEIQEL